MLIQRWMKCKTAARLLSFSPATIFRRRLEMQDDYVSYRIRYMELQLRPDGELLKRYFGPDVFALGKNPVPSQTVRYVPILLIEPPAIEANSSFFDAQETDDSLWLRINPACEYLDVTPDVIQRRAIPVEETKMFVPYHVRYEERRLNAGGRRYRRYFKPDLASWLVQPCSLQQMRDKSGQNSGSERPESAASCPTAESGGVASSGQQAHPAANPGTDGKSPENPVRGSIPPTKQIEKTPKQFSETTSYRMSGASSEGTCTPDDRAALQPDRKPAFLGQQETPGIRQMEQREANTPRGKELAVNDLPQPQSKTPELASYASRFCIQNMTGLAESKFWQN
jgi:hypothetical protein